MKNLQKLILFFLENRLFSRMKAVVLLAFLIICSDSANAQTSEVEWMEGSWGVRLIIRGGKDLDTFVANGYDYVEAARQIVRDYPNIGHVMTNLTNNANSSLYTLRQNNYIDIANEIHPDFVPSLENEQVIFDVIQVFRDAGIKVILYINHWPNMGEGSAAQIAGWENFKTARGLGNYDAFNLLMRGFLERLDGLVDGYWIDKIGGADSSIPPKSIFINQITETNPNAALGVNFRKSYFSGITVDSDGPDERDPDNYKVIKYEANDIWSHFTAGHVTSIGGQKAPSNSWGYDEFTVPDMVESPLSVHPETGRVIVKHMFAPIRRRWSQATEPLMYDKDQAYRFVKRIVDAGAAITFSTTITAGGLATPDEVEVLKHVSSQLAANADYVPYVRPEGAFLVGETAPDYRQYIDFRELPEKDVNEADFSPASASSGAPITYTSSDTSVAIVVNNLIRLQGAGTTTITASQGGNDTFAAAEDVTRQLTVTGEDRNFALGGIATQSRTIGHAVASRAIDGNTNGSFRERSVTIAAGPNAWWEVDLGDTHRITDIIVFNPISRYRRRRSSNFTVSVINSSGTVTYSQRITGRSNPSVSIDAGGVLGQTIRVESNLWRPLSLAEVQIFGKEFSKFDQRITFSSIPEKELGDDDFDLDATASSGYNVSYTSTNTDVATIEDGKIRIIAAGTSDIIASQAGDDIYNPAPDVIRVLTVVKKNLALNGTATQSTTLGVAEASRAIDGDTNGNFGSNSVSAAAGPNAWWEVDLGNNYSIADITIFNRTNNCCISRLSDFTVSVIDSSGAITYTETITTAPTPSITLAAGDAVGQIVRIQSNLTSTLNLAEVQVFESGSTSLPINSARTSSGKTTLGVETSDADDVIYVYPNPVTDILNVKISGSKTVQLDIVNYAGKRVLSQDIKEASAVVDLSNLSSGIYILKVTDGQQVQTKKIIKK